jgi:hypothetical protein
MRPDQVSHVVRLALQLLTDPPAQADQGRVVKLGVPGPGRRLFSFRVLWFPASWFPASWFPAFWFVRR